MYTAVPFKEIYQSYKKFCFLQKKLLVCFKDPCLQALIACRYCGAVLYVDLDLQSYA